MEYIFFIFHLTFRDTRDTFSSIARKKLPALLLYSDSFNDLHQVYIDICNSRIFMYYTHIKLYLLQI